MPVQRLSRGFKDISMSFKVNPVNNDLIALKNETAIARSVRNIVLTIPGERFFQPNFGSEVNRLLFNNIDDISASLIESQIKQSIENYESRVLLRSLRVNPNFDNNSFDITIIYDIIGADVPSQELQFALQSTR